MYQIGQYQLTNLLGRGSSGEVFQAYNIKTKQKVAIKKVRNDDVTIHREIEILQQLHCPYIVQIYDVLEKEGFYYIVMEYAETMTLLDYINTRTGPIEEYLAKRIVYQLIKCLVYLHETAQIIHRDFKPENIMIDKELNIKVIDFGLSNKGSSEANKFSTACGSPFYAAPEIIKGEEYSYAADIWSLGVVIYCLIYGVLPFYDENLKSLFKKILYSDPSYYSYVSDQANDIIKKCLNKTPGQRATLQDLLKDPWIGCVPLKMKQAKSSECLGQEPQIYEKYCSTNPSIFKPIAEVKRRKFPVSVLNHKKRASQLKPLAISRNPKLVV